MRTKKFLILPLIFVILFTGLIPFSFSSEESEAREDIQAGCRDGNTLVFRFAYKDYVCVSPETADRWEDLGLAEIYQEFAPEKQETKPVKLKPQFEESSLPPSPPKKTTTISSDTGCRDGYAQVFRFIYGDTICTSISTATSWERLGLAEILAQPTQSEKVEQTQELLPQQETVVKEYVEQEKTVKEKTSVPQKVTKTKSSTKFVLPDYPNQPSINPKLESTNDFWNPPEIYKVNERIWVAVGYDVANSIMIEGDKGIIIVDTLGSYESAQKVLSDFRQITDKPVKTIIYTDGSPDHVQGTKAFLDEGDGDVEIISHENLLELYLDENSLLGTIIAKRSAYASGLFLPSEGFDKPNLGVFPNPSVGNSAFIPPTHTFSSTFSLDISGVKMELVHKSGGKSDSIYIWLPEDKALLSGDYVYAIFPNIHSLTGGGYNDPLEHIKVLDDMILLEPQFLVPSHVKPIEGTEDIVNILSDTRDVTQYIFDQTIRGMNEGYTADELSHKISMPSWFDEHSWLTQARGQIPWHVKEIYFANLGWFQGDAASLLSVSDNVRAKKIVDGFGGIDETLKQVKNAIDDEEYYWAAELATYVLKYDPENNDAKKFKAYALRVIGQQMLSADARNWALTTALDLEGKITIDTESLTKTSPEQLKVIPIENLLKILPTKINPDKISDTEFILNVIYSDTEQEFTFHFRNGILVIVEGLNSSEDHTIILTTDTHKLILGGNLSISDAINSGQVKSDGNDRELREWLDYIDPILISTKGIRD